MKCDNPPDKAIIKFMAILSAILIIIGFVILAVEWGAHNGLFGFVIMVGGGACIIIGNWYREYYKKPLTIESTPQGIIMSMNYSNNVTLNWDEILGIFAYNDSDSLLKSNGAGFILPKYGHRYWTTCRAALMVATEYRLYTGKELSMVKLNENIRAFKKRVKRSN